MSLTGSAEYIQIQDKQEILAPDLVQLSTSTKLRINQLAKALAGGQDSFMPLGQPITVTAGPGSLQITAGGAGQWLYVNDQFCDNCPATQLAITSGASSPRIDLIVASGYVASGDPQTRNVYNVTAQADSPTTVYNNFDTVAFSVVQGLPASVPVPPTAPAGSVGVASVYVAAGATSVSTSNITQVLPNSNSVSANAATVASINGLTSTIQIQGGAGITISSIGSNTLQIASNQTLYSQPPVWRSGPRMVALNASSGGIRTLKIQPGILPPNGIIVVHIANPTSQSYQIPVIASGVTQTILQTIEGQSDIAQQGSGQEYYNNYATGSPYNALDFVQTAAAATGNTRIQDKNGTILAQALDDGSTHILGEDGKFVSYGMSYAYSTTTGFPHSLLLYTSSNLANSGASIPVTVEIEISVFGGVNANFGTNAGTALVTGGTTQTSPATTGASLVAALPFSAIYGQYGISATTGYGAYTSLTLSGSSSDIWYLSTITIPSSGAGSYTMTGTAWELDFAFTLADNNGGVTPTTGNISWLAGSYIGSQSVQNPALVSNNGFYVYSNGNVTNTRYPSDPTFITGASTTTGLSLFPNLTFGTGTAINDLWFEAYGGDKITCFIGLVNNLLYNGNSPPPGPTSYLSQQTAMSGATFTMTHL